MAFALSIQMQYLLQFARGQPSFLDGLRISCRVRLDGGRAGELMTDSLAVVAHVFRVQSKSKRPRFGGLIVESVDRWAF